MTDDIYVKDTSIKISYDDLETHVQMRFRDVDSAKLSCRLLKMLLENIEKRIANTEHYEILQQLPYVEHAEYFMDFGNSNSDIIGRQLDYKQLSKEDTSILESGASP